MKAPIRFAALARYLRAHGYTLVRISGSHHVFTKPGSLPISIPVHKNKVKRVYVRQVKAICEGQSPPKGD
ncbi:MAG: type II toxin-antitoxin system HicA family toxin [Phycisphaeraceae bacterium]|nr:type II toxin-antitoxin system HicA family toxin [Phycisphaeraceae bacterium]